MSGLDLPFSGQENIIYPLLALLCCMGLAVVWPQQRITHSANPAASPSPVQSARSSAGCPSVKVSINHRGVLMGSTSINIETPQDHSRASSRSNRRTSSNASVGDSRPEPTGGVSRTDTWDNVHDRPIANSRMRMNRHRSRASRPAPSICCNRARRSLDDDPEESDEEEDGDDGNDAISVYESDSEVYDFVSLCLTLQANPPKRDYRAVATMDTGAEVNAVSKGVMERLGLRVGHSPEEVKGLGGKPVMALALVWLTFRLPCGLVKTAPFRVFEERDMIGHAVLLCARLTLDLDHMRRSPCGACQQVFVR
ncbi:hypothetical protein CLCR_06135 [Cladophialophora carrionii]|uniref:Uncharacterized protein n=1 Tax=Cladophialophora carrionii TaxID=86049 RepID=A0A1C1C8X2_9EURO|nr:hypothetical protein CLCR_06135 [Cladophialophora carrionii]